MTLVPGGTAGPGYLWRPPDSPHLASQVWSILWFDVRVLLSEIAGNAAQQSWARSTSSNNNYGRNGTLFGKFTTNTLPGGGVDLASSVWMDIIRHVPSVVYDEHSSGTKIS